MNKTHTVKWETTMDYEEGWGVVFTAIHDEETGRVVDVDAQVYSIHPENIVILGQVPCVAPPDKNVATFVPLENFKHLDDLTVDDTHDLRDRWFESHEAAEEHLKYTLNRFHHPQPWESFVQL